MVLLLLTFCLLLLPLWESVTVLCFVVRYFMSILVLQSSWWRRESWLLCLICLPGVSWWLSGSSSQCHGVVCCLWLWYFLIIFTYYFRKPSEIYQKIKQRVYQNLPRVRETHNTLTTQSSFTRRPQSDPQWSPLKNNKIIFNSIQYWKKKSYCII